MSGSKKPGCNLGIFTSLKFPINERASFWGARGSLTYCPCIALLLQTLECKNAYFGMVVYLFVLFMILETTLHEKDVAYHTCGC